MITKQVTFLGQTASGIHCQSLFGSAGCFEKVAGAPPFADWETGEKLRDFISRITKRDRQEKCYALVNALGAGEYFGNNINADYYPWNGLCHVGDDYGYQTFLSAHAYQHHRNKDSSRAFGRPVLSELNHAMKRVELIVELDREKARIEGADGIITRVDAGEFPDVSMGCFIAGTMVTMGDGTRKAIELIQVGDEVMTHRGQVRRVTETHRRQYRGSMYAVRADGHRTVRCTRQHPWAFVREEDVKFRDDHANLRWRDDASAKDERWVHAECLDDEPTYLVEPIFQHHPGITPFVVQPSRAEARLLGYYLAEGHLVRNKAGELAGIELTTHMDDEVHKEIEALCLEFGTKNAPAVFDRVNSAVSRGIWIFDERLARFCHRHAGQYSKEKLLSREVLSWKPELQRELLGAYANGDGHGPEDGSLKLSTASVDLAHQWLVLLPRLGIIPSLGILEHKAGSGKSVMDTTEFVVHIGKQWAQKLRDVTSKVQRVEIEKTKLSRKIVDNKIVTPIRELESLYVETEVFNFEVEEDSSYLVEGLAVHNCKVPYDVCLYCGHRSKTKADYCVHMMPPPELRHKYGPNKIMPNGVKIGVDNPFPRFFDISFVFIGADKTAKVMAKLASKGEQLCFGDVCAMPIPSAEAHDILTHRVWVKGADLAKTASASYGCSCEGACGGDPLAEAFMVKEAEGPSRCGAVMASLPRKKKVAEILKEVPVGVFSTKRLPDLESKEPDLPDPLIREMASRRLANSLGSMSSLGVVLKPHEFARTVLRRMGEDGMADEFERRRGTLRPALSFGECPIETDNNPDDILEMVGPLLRSLVKERSALGRPFAMRISIMMPSRKIPLPTRTPLEHPLLDKISAAYNAYRREVLTKLSQATEVVKSDPRLREEVMGDGLVRLFSKQADAIPFISLDSLSYLMGAHLHDRGLLTNTAVAVSQGLLDEGLLAQGS